MMGSGVPGPYATAILHFQISFPDTYPGLPPLVTFSTDIFHPLITPLNTYMYTTDIQDGGTVSATDDERLPPGGFSLRHGFPAWFGRGGGGGSRSRQQQQQQPGQPAQTPPRSVRASQSTQSTPGSAGSAGRSPGPLAHHLQTRRRGDVSTYAVLRYIRRTFDDEAALDSVPLEAAGNPGAWHAWRAHQRQLGKAPAAVAPTAAADEGGPPRLDGEGAGGAPAVARRPGEWNWEHVWEERVRKGIAASLSEPVLYGNAGAADDVVSCRSRDWGADKQECTGADVFADSFPEFGGRGHYLYQGESQANT